MIGSGAAVAILPATVQAVGSRLYSTDEQALIALALGFGVLLSGVIAAVLLEARLADPRLDEKTYLPRWTIAVGIVGGLILCGFPSSGVLTAIAMPLVMTGFQMGRTHAICVHRWKTELGAAALIAIGSGSAFLLSLSRNAGSVIVLGATVVGVQLVRGIRTRHTVSQRTDVSVAMWVGTETAVVAAIPFLTNIVVLAQLGPAEAVGFRLILTVLGVLQPLLGYMRTRLLGQPSARLTIALSCGTLLALLSLLALDGFGVFETVFGQAWATVPFLALAAACGWKALSLPATIPFTAMRRRGDVRPVFAIRTASAVIYVTLGYLGAHLFTSLEGVFASFIAAEALTAIIFLMADHRRPRR